MFSPRPAGTTTTVKNSASKYHLFQLIPSFISLSSTKAKSSSRVLFVVVVFTAVAASTATVVAATAAAVFGMTEKTTTTATTKSNNNSNTIKDSITHPIFFAFHPAVFSSSSTASLRNDFLNNSPPSFFISTRYPLPSKIKTTLCETNQDSSSIKEYYHQQDPTNSELYSFRDVIHNIHSYQRMKIPERGTASTHAVFGSLLKSDMIEAYDVFCNKNIPVDLMTSNSWSDKTSLSLDDAVTVVAVVKLGNALNGHDGIVHGGILSLLLDDVIGFGYEALGIPIAFTANLSVNYMKPVPEKSTFLVTATLESREGRKLYWKANIFDVVEGEKRLLCDASSLYIIPRLESKL